MKTITLIGHSVLGIALAGFISGKVMAADSELQDFSKKIQAQIAQQNEQNAEQFKKLTQLINSQVEAVNKNVNEQVKKLNQTGNQERNKLRTVIEGQIKEVKAGLEKQVASVNTRLNDLGKKVGSIKTAG